MNQETEIQSGDVSGLAESRQECSFFAGSSFSIPWGPLQYPHQYLVQPHVFLLLISIINLGHLDPLDFGKLCIGSFWGMNNTQDSEKVGNTVTNTVIENLTGHLGKSRLWQ